MVSKELVEEVWLISRSHDRAGRVTLPGQQAKSSSLENKKAISELLHHRSPADASFVCPFFLSLSNFL